MVENVTLWMSFMAGVVSFASPCVLPLVPGYVSYLSGVSVQQMQAAAAGQSLDRREKGRILVSALLFVAGFTTVFVLLGATATRLGVLLTSNINLLTDNSHASMDPVMGATNLRVLLCNLYRCEDK